MNLGRKASLIAIAGGRFVDGSIGGWTYIYAGPIIPIDTRCLDVLC